ncbi:hypothetical protein BDV06DRAFT_228649 [Aspergillus oleicola]
MPHPISVPPPGIYTPLLTIHHDHSDQTSPVDFSSTLSHLTRLAASGIAGIIIHYPNGQSPHLSHAERVSLVRSIRTHLTEHGHGGFTIIADVGAHTVHETLEQIEEMKNEGADCVLVLPPGYGRGAGLRCWSMSLNGPAIMGLMYDVAQSSPLPILTYDVSNATGRNGSDSISDATIHLTLSMPKIVGWKSACEAAHKPSQIVGTFSPISSSSSLASDFILAALGAGAQGVVVSLANVVPKLCVKLFELYKSGSACNAQELQRQLKRAGEALSSMSTEEEQEVIAQYYGYGSQTGVGSRSSGDIKINSFHREDGLVHNRGLLEMERRL